LCFRFFVSLLGSGLLGGSRRTAPSSWRGRLLDSRSNGSNLGCVNNLYFIMSKKKIQNKQQQRQTLVVNSTYTKAAMSAAKKRAPVLGKHVLAVNVLHKRILPCVMRNSANDP
jgi:hypothetical protein